MIAQNQSYGREFQMRLLANILRAPEFRSHLLQGTLYQQDLDVPCHRAILQAATTFASENGEALSRGSAGAIPPELLNQVLLSLINTGEISKSEIPAIDDALDVIYGMRLDTPVMLAILPTFIQYQRTRRALNEAYGRPDFTPGDVFAEVEKIRADVGMMSSDETVIHDPSNPRTSLPSDTEPPIPLGIDSLDARLDGGIKRRKVVMICAYTGYGKTAFGLNVCWRNSEGRGLYGSTGLRSVFVTAEMPYQECMCRYYSMLLAYPFSIIWKGENIEGGRDRETVNRDIENVIENRVQTDPTAARSMANFRVWDYSTKALTPSMLDRQLAAQQEAGTPVDVMTIDYIDKMILAPTKENDTFRKDRRQELGKISADIEQLAIKYNCLILVLTQSNDEGARKSGVRMTSSRDARLKNDPVSLWIGLGASEQDRANNIMRATIDKNRDGATFSMNLSTRLDIQRFNDYTEDVESGLQFGVTRRQRD